ncbi:MAG: hypothetical protein LAP21_12915 [Acidobacteriia bacterium]|nr:hypothetical protein [Terriglobia bacterium]
MAEKEPAVVTVAETDETLFMETAVIKAPAIKTPIIEAPAIEAAVIETTIVEATILETTVIETALASAVTVPAFITPFSSITIAGLRRSQRGTGRNQGRTNQNSLDSIHSILPCYARPDSHSDRSVGSGDF